jgi:hypothetical protein
MAINNSYTNADGLTMRFGTEKAKVAQVGTPRPAGSFKQIVATISYDKLEAFGTVTLLDELRASIIPVGAIITSSRLDTITAFTSGGSATLDIGIYKTDGTTAIDADGIDAAIAKTAIDAVGEKVVNDGALVNGAALTFDGILTATVGTANFTAGKALLTIEYYLPANL